MSAEIWHECASKAVNLFQTQWKNGKILSYIGGVRKKPTTFRSILDE
jgi:hypothetical protein